MSQFLNRALTVAALMLTASPLCAHTIVGNRVFPATLTIDDPGTNDELALPTFAYIEQANPDGSPGAQAFGLGWEYGKTITPDVELSIGSAGYQWQVHPTDSGLAHTDVQTKWAFFQDPDHEFIMSAAIDTEIGNTGTGDFNDSATTVTPKFYIGKGFGDAPVDLMKPFALTGEVDTNIPTDGSTTSLTWGGTVQYSLFYENSFVQQLPNFLNRLIPAFEADFNTPVSNIGPAQLGNFSPYDTTGVYGPSLYYIGQYFEIGVMAQIPINRASGYHPGALAVLDFFLDDIAPTSLGKPLFSAPLSPYARY